MKFKLDENLSRRAADLIRVAGHDAVTVATMPSCRSASAANHGVFASWVDLAMKLLVRGSVRRSPSWRDDLDQRREASKVRFVEGQQSAFAMRQHGRDDIGVMDLTTSEGIAAA